MIGNRWHDTKWRSGSSRACLYNVRECGKRPKIAIFVHTFYGRVAGSRSTTKMALEFFPYMPIQRTWVWVASKIAISVHFLWDSRWQSVEDQNGGRVFPVNAYTAYVSVGNVEKCYFCTHFLWKSCWQSVVHAYTAYVSVDNVKKSQFLYTLSMGKLLTIGRRPKWQSSFSRTCLYSVRECG